VNARRQADWPTKAPQRRSKQRPRNLDLREGVTAPCDRCNPSPQWNAVKGLNVQVNGAVRGGAPPGWRGAGRPPGGVVRRGGGGGAPPPPPRVPPPPLEVNRETVLAVSSGLGPSTGAACALVLPTPMISAWVPGAYAAGFHGAPTCGIEAPPGRAPAGR